jgi:isocitrate/isopropylmalate dehydrogenase
MSNNAPITVAYGDGIGCEIMEASLQTIKEAGERIENLRTFDGTPGYSLAQGQ